jgi:hypothetical protein
MTEIAAEADIRCAAEQIFDLIIDFRGQDRWLTRSSAYHGTLEVSSDPVTLGTTYREPGPFGVRNGRVTEFERPTAITFHQPIPWSLKLAQPVLIREFRTESTRTLLALKAYADMLPGA